METEETKLELIMNGPSLHILQQEYCNIIIIIIIDICKIKQNTIMIN